MKFNAKKTILSEFFECFFDPDLGDLNVPAVAK